MWGKSLVRLVVLLAMTVVVAAGKATVLDLQEGNKVNVKMVEPTLVDPRVGGITLTLNSKTYGGPNADKNIGLHGVWAGKYLVEIYDLSNNLIVGNYETFCLDVGLDPVRFTAQIHDVLDNVSSDLEWMWGTYYSEIGSDPIKAAAMQLAVWEVIHKGGSNPRDLRMGNFYLSALDTGDVDNRGATLNGLIDQANTYLDSSKWTYRTDLMSLNRQGSQPFLIVVPEPATFILLGLGLVTVLLRKRF